MTKKERIFNSIALDIANKEGLTLKTPPYSYHLCPDQYVGVIKDKDNWQEFKRTDIFTDETCETLIKDIQGDNILLLILESPHTDEFDKNGIPIGPANGPTGDNIRTYIADIFPKYKDYNLILMNAIPFQCSLGVATEHFRYDVFKTTWNDEEIDFAKFFNDRLQILLNKLLDKNVVLVNACTKGYNKEKDDDEKPFLWRLVENNITNLTLNKEKDIQYYRISHPSSWNRNKQNRKIKDNKITEKRRRTS